MSAETLRKAASLMRERAETVTARLTKCERPDECSAGGFCGSPQLADMWPENADHIASWHPAVALAVADLLDELLRSLSVFGEPADDDPLWERSTAAATLRLARAYIGESA